MGPDHFGSDRTRPVMEPLRAGCYKRIPSAFARVGKSCVTACVAQDFLSKVLSNCPNQIVSGTSADRVGGDTLGMHPELLVFRDHRVDAVEQTLVEWRQRIGRTGLAEPLLGIRNHHL